MLWPKHQYELIDFGRGRKLERFGKLVLDRPCPAADQATQSLPDQWRTADMHIDSESKDHGSSMSEWLPAEWFIAHSGVRMQLRLTPFGHVGLFPEHALNWQWLLERPRCHHGDEKALPNAPRLLNLFAYTGAASLVLAQAGWQVAHVDSSAPTVAWARHNAALSGLEAAPIRWLVEDARRYAAREVRRGQRYDAIMLDPPTYGHGPQGKAWQIQRDLPELLELCCQLLHESGSLILSGHTYPPACTTSELTRVRKQHGLTQAPAEYVPLVLVDRSGRPLNFGWTLRV